MPLSHVVPVAHAETDQVVRHRQRVVAAVSVAGAAALGASLSTSPGSKRFYGATLSVAGVWVAGGLLSGPLHLGWIQARDQRLRRPVVTPVITGVGAFGFFYACALVARRIPVLDEAISRVLVFAEEGDEPLVLLTTLANGLGEEIFFRGALYAALEDHPVVASTAVYALATTTTRNPALVLAAGVMGSLFALQRRATGGLQAPAITHVTWSTLMVRYLPPLFRHAHGEARR
ncbi:CPBP family intramembrane metalloprotease [Nocardioides mesophilus]|uniref:CPBP family intramembrane metalloprotease n=2 Tax=Nocardioides mesophilus TaxID=433659 RepID=A0A7G9RHD6_9ACTN|nr:CPBP family intramembrane metalloprotease [Nocardioides mesophilus]